MEVSPSAKCKKSAVQPNGTIILPLVLNFALRANELSAQAAKSGLPPEKTVGNFGGKISIYNLAVLL
ncbi:hypothetical protein KKG71_01075 [Patescibacteria group bacterium]|nr:hypothetical protein [Patescibacteria group bacterium]